MSKSNRLKLSQVRQAFRLVGEAVELGEDPAAWRNHVLKGAAALIDANAAFADEESLGDSLQSSQLLGFTQTGLGPKEMQLFGQLMQMGGFHAHPLYAALKPLLNKPITAIRRQLVDDDRWWYRHPVIDIVKRPADMDDVIHSRQPVAGTAFQHMLAFFRPFGAKSFSMRDRKLIHLLHTELGHQFRNLRNADPANALAPRLRRIVGLLREGKSEKQVAGAVGLSVHTVHTYVRDLCRQLGASGRFEALRMLAPRRTLGLHLSCFGQLVPDSDNPTA